MKKYKIYLCEYIHPSAYAKLAERAEILTEESQLPMADAAINRNLRMDRAWLERCPNLKVIGIHGTGTDGVELEAARERGIRVINVPGENAVSVAELIVTFALMLSRRVHQFDRMLCAGAPVTNGGGSLTGHELSGKVFGMIGCGNIACKAAKMLTAAFGMTAIGYSPSLTEEKAAALGIRRCASPAEVAAQADVINIGASLNAGSRNLVDAAVLACAKPGAILINTARGGIVDEDALYDALASGRLAAAACDVFRSEPPTRENRLLSLPNFLATPHIGANTDEALDRVSNSTVDQILAVLDGSSEITIRWVV